MDTVISVIPADETQEPLWARAAGLPYVVHAANWKRARGSGPVIGTFDAFVPAFSLNLRCALRRDQRGNPYVDLPRRVETPNGVLHLKRLVRWQTAHAEAAFQQAAMTALRALLARIGARL